MRYEDDLMSGGVTNRDLAFLSAGVMWIGKRQSQRVEEDRRRLIEGYAVLLDVGLCLPRIPLIDHMFSLPQRNRWTSPLFSRQARAGFDR